MLASEELSKLASELENYSLCEVLYSVLKDLKKGKQLGWLLEMEDRDIYSSIERVKFDELEDEK